MSTPDTSMPSPKTGADLAVLGGGLSGTLAAYLLGRAGYAVTLIDRHRTFPEQFRAEKLCADHIDTLDRFGLVPALSRRAAAFDTVLNLRHGRLLDRTYSRHYGILYRDLIETVRAELPDNVRFVAGQVSGLRTGARRQRVAIHGQEEVTARLLVLATGAGDILRRDLNIARRVLRARQSIAFGFDLSLAERERFTRTGVTCYGDGASDGVDYLTLFPVAGAMRVNLFTYREPGDSWVRAFRERPNETLAVTFPRLVETIGSYAVSGRIDSWITDIVVADNHRQDGIVLIGDAFQTSCPAAGIGVSRLLSDVERLCHVHLPRWMRGGAFAASDLATFYDDPDKRAMDLYALQMADFRRGLTIGTDLGAQLARGFHFARRRALHMVDALSPSLAARLREIRQGHSRRLAAPEQG